MKLGRRPATELEAEAHRNRAPLLRAHLPATSLLAPPLARYWGTADGTPYGAKRAVSMFRNNELGDCTVAALAHQDQIAAATVGEVSPITDDDVVKMYRGSGYNGDPSTDDGWSNAAAAEAAFKAGWIVAMARFDCTNERLLRVVVNEFGFAYVGIDLPLSAQDQMGKVWDVPHGAATSRYKRGSWGGHAVGVVDADAEGVTVATWGALQRASWPFVFSYFDPDDGIATLNRYWIKRELSPSGVRLAELRDDLTRLKVIATL